MKYNKIAITYFLLLAGTTAVCQTVNNKELAKHLETGNALIVNENYFSASQEFLKAVNIKPDDYNLCMKLADAYRLNTDYTEAEKWYERCMKLSPKKITIAMYRLGTMQKVNEKYYDAENTLSTFIKTFKPFTDEERVLLKRAHIELKGCQVAQMKLQEPEKDIALELLPFPISSKNSDYAPLIFQHDSSLVITSARADAKGSDLNLSSGEGRTDNFRFEKRGDRWLRTDNDDNFDIVNTLNDDGAGSLTRNKTKYYYTICDPECAIYVSNKINDKFTPAVKLNESINAGYWNAQPALTSNGDTMFFVSKRQGGKGQNDIWMSINRDKSGRTENWAPARNLPMINTSEAEISPFWDNTTRTLYFSSGGHPGFGGMDIFKTRLSKSDSIVNVGLPFNSGRNDFFLVIGKDKGYFVSDRLGGLGLGDIYSFNRKIRNIVLSESSDKSLGAGQSIACYGILYFDDTHEPLSNVMVQLNDDKGNTIKKAVTSKAGEFLFDSLSSDKTFRIVVEDKDPHIRAVVEYAIKREGQGIKKLVIPKDIPKATPASNKPLAGKQVAVESVPEKTLAEAFKPVSMSEPVKNQDKVERQDGTLAFKTDETSVLKNNASSVRATTKTETSAKVINPKPIAATSKKIPAKVYFENIYFNFNSSEILPSGKNILNEVAEFYLANKNITIEIKAFTDSFGDKEYNRKLSEERGTACYKYLAEKGIDLEALKIVPQGADKPVGNNNLYTGRQANRRVEFSINGANTPYQPNAMAYIVEPHMTLYSVARKFSMTVNELKILNGIESEYIQAYSVLRVKRDNSAKNISPETLDNLKNGIQEYRFENMKFVPVGIY